MCSQRDEIAWEIKAAPAETYLEKIGNSEVPAHGQMVLSDSAETARACMEKGIPVIGIVWEGRRTEEVRTSEASSFPFLKRILSLHWFGGEADAEQLMEQLDERFLTQSLQRELGIPWKILETERCIVRESTEGDVDAFYEIYSSPGMTDYIEPLFENPEQERAYAREYAANVYEVLGYGVWTICLRRTGEVIGRAGLSWREGFDGPELGYIIGADWQRQGIAREVSEAILVYGKEQLGFEKYYILTDDRNLASGRLCQSLGFVPGKTQLIKSEDGRNTESELRIWEKVYKI